MASAGSTKKAFGEMTRAAVWVGIERSLRPPGTSHGWGPSVGSLQNMPQLCLPNARAPRIRDPDQVLFSAFLPIQAQITTRGLVFSRRVLSKALKRVHMPLASRTVSGNPREASAP